MPSRDLTARGRTLLSLAKPEHLEVIASEGPSALVRRLHTSLGVAELLRWFAENAAELLADGESTMGAGRVPDDAAEWWAPPMRTPMGEWIHGMFEHPCDGGVYSEDGYDHRGPIVTVRNLLRSVRMAERELEAAGDE